SLSATGATRIVSSGRRINQSAGVHLSFGTPYGGNAGVTYIQGGVDPKAFGRGPNIYNEERRFEVFGANLNLTPVRGIGLSAEWATTTGLYPTGVIGVSRGLPERFAADVGLNANFGNLGV
ncbi:MAG: hypothetical protein C4321_04380, partial [Chloroflexota bacterium]